MRGYDAWLTRDPWGDMPDILVPGDKGYPTCECGAWLTREPGKTPQFCAFGIYIPPVEYITWDITMAHCDGKPLYGYETGCDNPTTKVHEPHDYVAWAAQLTHRICKKCGKDNIEVDA